MSRIRFKDFNEVLKALEQIEHAPFNLKGDWDAYQHLMHCGQAIQYSLTGYPAEKPKLFQQTIGKTTFLLFKTYGHLSHNTNEFTQGSLPIPGNGLKEGAENYRNHILRIMDWDGPFHSHQFFGRLSKKDVLLFHTMHFANHYEQFEF